MKLDKDNFNWYGFDHDKVRQKFGDLDGNLEYIGSFCVKGMYRPAAVYYAPNPDRSKGHMNYVFFWKEMDPVLFRNTLLVSGMSPEAMEEYRVQEGIYCQECDDLIYSVMRHDMRYCGCKKTFVDGGRDYMRYGGGLPVMIDLLTGETKDPNSSGAV